VIMGNFRRRVNIIYAFFAALTDDIHRLAPAEDLLK
jgi:hypothetical protein